MQTVYVDLFFLINFSMDFLCLYLTAGLMSEKIRPWRNVLAASFGGVYACFALFSPFQGVWSMLCDLSACMLLALIAFGVKGRLGSAALTAIVYAAVSMVLGGFMTALFNLFNRLELSELISGGESAEESISVWLLIILAVVGGLATKLCGGFFRSRSMRRFADVRVSFGGKSMVLHAMADSGNLLREPVSGRRCVVADVDKLSAVLPREIISAARQRSAACVSTLPREYARRVCLIPTRTATGEGLLVGVRVDSITVSEKKGERQVDAIVVPTKIEGGAEGKDALVPSELLI